MKKVALLSLFIGSFLAANAQTYSDSTIDMSAKRVQWAGIQQFAIGSYGEAHYNSVIDLSTRNNGKIDLHRVITFLGYRFNENLQFFSEIEFEHADEIYVEQAFLNYHFNDKFNFKAGQILIPMGYVNEFHEPTLFNGVERPNVEKYVAPSTWRELGFGFTGNLDGLSMKYQIYAVNGFLSYDGGGKLRGSDGFRKGRQKGAESTMSSPNLSAKVGVAGQSGINDIPSIITDKLCVKIQDFNTEGPLSEYAKTPFVDFKLYKWEALKVEKIQNLGVNPADNGNRIYIYKKMDSSSRYFLTKEML